MMSVVIAAGLLRSVGVRFKVRGSRFFDVAIEIIVVDSARYLKISDRLYCAINNVQKLACGQLI